MAVTYVSVYKVVNSLVGLALSHGSHVQSPLIGQLDEISLSHVLYRAATNVTSSFCPSSPRLPFLNIHFSKPMFYR